MAAAPSPATDSALTLRAMLRPLALTLLVLLSACASPPPIPPAPVEMVVTAPQAETVEPPDPNIHSLSQEMEEAGVR